MNPETIDLETMLKNIVSKKALQKPSLVIRKSKTKEKSFSKLSVKSDHSSSRKDRNIEHHASLV